MERTVCGNVELLKGVNWVVKICFSTQHPFIIPVFLYGTTLSHTSPGALERTYSTLASRGGCGSTSALHSPCQRDSKERHRTQSEPMICNETFFFWDCWVKTNFSFFMDLNVEIGLETNDRVLRMKMKSRWMTESRCGGRNWSWVKLFEALNPFLPEAWTILRFKHPVLLKKI